MFNSFIALGPSIYLLHNKVISRLVQERTVNHRNVCDSWAPSSDVPRVVCIQITSPRRHQHSTSSKCAAWIFSQLAPPLSSMCYFKEAHRPVIDIACVCRLSSDWRMMSVVTCYVVKVHRGSSAAATADNLASLH